MSGFGTALKDWRKRRRLSHLELALRAGTTQRHVSFMESGRSMPGRGRVVRVAESLQLPLWERNALLLSAGYAPSYPETELDDPALQPVMESLRRLLDGHSPYPAIVVNRFGELVAANDGLDILTEGVAPELLEPPVNVLRLALHPRGMAPRILNFDDWAQHVLERPRQDNARAPHERHMTMLAVPPDLGLGGTGRSVGRVRAPAFPRSGCAHAAVRNAGSNFPQPPRPELLMSGEHLREKRTRLWNQAIIASRDFGSAAGEGDRAAGWQREIADYRGFRYRELVEGRRAQHAAGVLVDVAGATDEPARFGVTVGVALHQNGAGGGERVAGHCALWMVREVQFRVQSDAFGDFGLKPQLLQSQRRTCYEGGRHLREIGFAQPQGAVSAVGHIAVQPADTDGLADRETTTFPNGLLQPC